MDNLKDYTKTLGLAVGQRWLLVRPPKYPNTNAAALHQLPPEYYEATVLEISPSQKTVKLRYANKFEEWKNVTDLTWHEMLEAEAVKK